jgi:eukaryotic-like serine/threonine-protein kinase
MNSDNTNSDPSEPNGRQPDRDENYCPLGHLDETPESPKKSPDHDLALADLFGDEEFLILFLERYWPRHGGAVDPTRTQMDEAPEEPVYEGQRGGAIGRFQIRRELGRGGFAIVYLAHDRLRGGDVALKIPLPEITKSLELRQRFEREARAAASLDHPHINAIYETSQPAAGDLYISSHYCAGPTLHQWLKHRVAPVAPESAARLVTLIANAVQHAHERGILHRDLKPANLLLERVERPSDSDGEKSMFEGFFPRLCDFGLAKIIDNALDDAPTRTGILLGTPRYMAPEQAAGQSSQVGRQTDIYALGVILYELLAGRPPFVADTDLETLRQIRSEEPVPIRRLQPKVPRDLDTICMKCLEKERARRYASAGDLAADLRRFLDHSPVKARPISLARRVRLWTRRHPAQALVLMAASILLVGLPGGLAWHTAQLRQAVHRAQQFELEARASERSALANAATVRQHMYSSDMRLASELLKEGEFSALATLIDRHDPAKANVPDHRGFEWWYLKKFRDIEKRSWEAHRGELNMLQFSADGRMLMTASDVDGSAKTWNVLSGRLLATIPTRKHDEPGDQQAAALSPDGTLAATIANDGADVWDATTREHKQHFKYGGKVFYVIFSPDSRSLLIGTENGTWLRSRDTWREERLLPPTRLARFSADGATLVTVPVPSYATDFQFFDLKRRKTKQTIHGWYPPRDLRYAPDARLLSLLTDGPQGSSIDVYAADTVQWRQIIKNEGTLRGLAFSPDGCLLASVVQDGSLRFWSTDAERTRGSLRATTNRISQFAFSPDGSTLATGTDRGTVSLWSHPLLCTPEPVHTFTAYHGPLIFNPKRDQIAVADLDRSVTLIDATTARTTCRLAGNLDKVVDLSFSPDGRRLATTDNHQVRCWDVELARQIWSSEAPDNHTIAWSPVSSLLAGGGSDHRVRLWDASTGIGVAALTGHTDIINMVRFFPDGRRLASASYDRTVRIWDVAKRREVGSPLTHDDPVLSLAVINDGHELAAGLAGGKLALWTLQGGKPQLRLKTSWYSGFQPWLGGQPLSMAFSDAGAILGTAGPGGILRAVKRTGGGLLFTLSGKDIAPTSAAYSANGALLATVSQSNELTIWNTATWHGRRAFECPLSVIRRLAFSPDGKCLATSGGSCDDPQPPPARGFPADPNLRFPVVTAETDSLKRSQQPVFRDFVPWQATSDTLRFWDLPTGREQRLLEAQPTVVPLSEIAWSRSQSDGRPAAAARLHLGRMASGGRRNILVAAGNDSGIWAWDMQQRTLLAHFYLNDRMGKQIAESALNQPPLVPQQALVGGALAPQLALSPDGKVLATLDGDGVVKLWDTNTWTQIAALPDKQTAARFLAFSPDGGTLAVNHRGQIRFYDRQTARRRVSIGEETASGILCGLFSPDGEVLTLGTLDGSVRRIDVATGRPLTSLFGHLDAVSSLAYAPDGRTLATGSWDRTVRLWHVASQREVTVLQGHRGRVHTVAFSPDGSVLASGGQIDDAADKGAGELFLWRAAPTGTR